METTYFSQSKLGCLTRTDDRNPRSVIVFGTTGSGKSTLLESYIEKEYQNGAKIVDVWDSKDDLEGAYTAFPPSEKQIKIMNSSEPVQKGIMAYDGRTYPTKIYHPMCKRIPTKLPDCFDIFSIPLNSMELEDLEFLAENTKPVVATRILHNVLKELGKNTTLPDLFDRIGDLAKRSEASTYFGQRIRMSSKTMYSFALKIFIEFSKEYTFSSGNNVLALNEEKFVKELNNQKVRTVISTKYVTDLKSKYFIVGWVMNQIAKLKTEGKIGSKVIVVLRDLFTLAPRFYNMDQMFKVVMVNKVYNILATFRSKDIEVCADNQDPTTLNTILGGQFQEILVGSIFHPGEVAYFAESGAMMDRNIIATISGLRSHAIKKFYDVYSGEFVISFFPHHRHKEPTDDFFRIWDEEHPGKYKDWSTLIARSKAENDNAEEKYKKMNKQIETEEADAMASKEFKVEETLPEEVKELVEFSRADVETVLNIKRDTAGRRIYEWKRIGLIELVGNPQSKGVRYRVIAKTAEEKPSSSTSSSSSEAKQ